MKFLTVFLILSCLVLTNTFLFSSTIEKVDNKLKYNEQIAQTTDEVEDVEDEDADLDEDVDDEDASGEDSDIDEAEADETEEASEETATESKEPIEMLEKSELPEKDVKRKIKKTKYVLADIEKIKNGDKEVLKTIYYYEFENILQILNENASQKKGSFADGISDKPVEKRKALKGFLGGLFNKDPRIRMASASIIKELLKNIKAIQVPSKRKDGVALTKEEKEKLTQKYKRQYYQIVLYIHSDTRKCYYLETVNRNKYLSTNRQGQQYLENVYQEVNILDLVIVREITLERLKTGSLKAKDFTVVNSRIFESLTVKIDNEPDYAVPINVLNNRISILTYSLGNPDPAVRKKAAELLLAEYYAKGTDNQTKNKIDKARANYLVLDDAFREYIKKEEEALKKEMAKKALEEQKERERLEKEKALAEKEKAEKEAADDEEDIDDEDTDEEDIDDEDTDDEDTDEEDIDEEDIDEEDTDEEVE